MGMKKFLLGLVGIVCALFTISAHALPAGYTELEYIESTGTQYIDTGFIPTSDYKHTLVFSTTDAGTGYIAGTGTDGGRGGNVKLTGGLLENVYVGSAEASATALVNNSSSYIVTSKTTLVMDLHNNAVSNVFLSGQNISSGNVATTVSTNPLYLFGSGSASPLNSKIYQDIIEQNGVLVRNMIPAKNSSGVIGMYDMVSGTFFENSGTGTFIAGPVARTACVNLYNPSYIYSTDFELVDGNILRNKKTDNRQNAQFNFYIKYENGGGHNVLATITSPGEYTAKFTVPDADTPIAFYHSGTSINLTFYAGQKLTPGSYVVSMKVLGTDSRVVGGLQIQDIKIYPTECYDIKVASTKYVESQFSALNTALANAVATVNTVVTQTIAQAASIATLQSGKQTRPADDPTDANNAENCPAGKKCLLVEDESGTPHWYEIFDPINRWVEAFFKVNPNGQYEENGVDFRRWQGNPDFRKTYIDGSTSVYVRQWTAATPARTVGGMYQTLPAGDLENAGSWAVEWDGTEGDIDAGAVYGIAKCTSVAGTFATKLTSAQETKFYELPAPVGQEDNANYPRESFKQCWCKMTAVGVPGEDGTAANGDVYPVNVASSSWVFGSTYSSADNCAFYCAFNCAYFVRFRASFRSAVFGM